MYRVGKEFIHPSVKEDFMRGVGDIKNLETIDKSSIIAAINELVDSTENKALLAEVLGAPVSSTDSYADMVLNINKINELFKYKLNSMNVDVSDVQNYSSLVDKFDDIIPGLKTKKYFMIEAPFDVDGLCVAMNPIALISKSGELIIFGGRSDFNGTGNSKQFTLNLETFKGVVSEKSYTHDNLTIPLIRNDESSRTFAYLTKNNINSTTTATPIRIDKTTLTSSSVPSFTSESINSQKYCISMYKHGLVGEHYRSNLSTAVYTYDETTNTWTSQGSTNGGMGSSTKILNEELENGFNMFVQTINGANGGLVYYDFGTKTYTKNWDLPSTIKMSSFDYALRLSDTKFLFKSIESSYIHLIDISDNSEVKIMTRSYGVVMTYNGKFYIYGGKAYHNNPTILNFNDLL